MTRIIPRIDTKSCQTLEDQGLKDKLSGVPETLLLPLWARATETRFPHPIIADPHAVELVEQIDYDFEKFSSAWKSQLGIAIRTEILDIAVTTFIEKAPRTIVINLGAGLDSRFQRIDNGLIKWYDIDLPQVIRIKNRFFKTSRRYRLIARSITDLSWMDEIQEQGNPVLIIAEGLLMYFNETEVRSLLDALINRFRRAEMLFEMIPIGALGTRRFHDALGNFDVEFKWSLPNSRLLETWNNKIKFIEEWCILDFHLERWGWLAPYALFPLTRIFLGEKIVRIRLYP